MSETKELLENEIYPALFDRVPDLKALSGFGFRRTSDGYRSTTTLKITGEPGDSKGAVCVYEKIPSRLLDYRGGSVSIWDYIQREEGLLDNRSVLLRLAELAGIALPEQSMSADQVERINQSRRIADAWECANTFFIDCLSGVDNPRATTSAAKRIRNYLTDPPGKGGRGYNPALFRLADQSIDRNAPKMEVGYMPGLPELTYHLQDSGFARHEVEAIMNSIAHAGPAVGSENVLSFPYRDQYGRIRGMVFRLVGSIGQTKYLYSKFELGSVLFGLRAVSGDRDLIVVESPLDAMRAAAEGIKNVIALGGSGDKLSKLRIDLAIKCGARKFTLMLDNDGPGAKGTDVAVTLLQTEYPDFRIYVASYPGGIKDLDELLTAAGVDGFNQVAAEAQPAWNYRLGRIYDRYSSTEEQAEPLTHKQVDTLLDEIVQTAAKLSTIDKDLFVQAFLSDEAIQSLGITRDSLQQTVDVIRQADLDKKQGAEFAALLTEARQVEQQGERGKALDLLSRKSSQIKAINKADQFAGLSAVYGEQSLRNSLASAPDALASGFKIDDVELMIPAAAISIIAGATSHGKSTLLTNLLLKLAELNSTKTFHLFSYEVDRDQYLINLLNAYIGDDMLAYSNKESIGSYFRGKKKITRPSGTYDLFRPNKLGVFEQGRIKFFADLINSGRVKIHYVTYNSDELIEAVRYINKTEPVGAVLVDYVQLIYTPPGKLRSGSSRQEEIKQMCIDLKDLAIETGLPLVFGAQFSREVTNLAQMHASKLGEAGDLERIANLIVGLWNNAHKNNGTPSAADLKIIHERTGSSKDSPPDPYTWYVEVLKSRVGQIGKWDIWQFMGNAGKVSN